MSWNKNLCRQCLDFYRQRSLGRTSPLLDVVLYRGGGGGGAGIGFVFMNKILVLLEAFKSRRGRMKILNCMPW